MLKQVDPLRLCKPGFRPLLELLRKNKIHTALYSNASRQRVNGTLAHLGLSDAFGQVVTNDDPGMQPKPDPTMLFELQRRLDLKARDCLVVESSVIGMEAARNAGCHCAMIMNDYALPSAVRERNVTFLGNARELEAILSRYIRHRKWKMRASGPTIADKRFPFTSDEARNKKRMKKIDRIEIEEIVLSKLSRLKKGRQFVGISGTVGSGKSQWAINLQTLETRLGRRLVVVDEDYFLLPVQQRLMMRDELYSSHECWVDWRSFRETIRSLREDHGTHKIQAYDRGTGDRTAQVALYWGSDAIVLVAGLYCLTPLHAEVDYSLQLAFTTTPEESSTREQQAALQTGRHSREGAQQLISEVYNPLRERLLAYIHEERKFPDIEFDVTIPDKPRMLIEDSDATMDS